MGPRVDNHYATLGVSRSAPSSVIRAAYRDMARELHPDRHLGSTPAERARAERVMRKVNEAWNVLGDPARRAAYDRQLPDPTRPPPPRPPSAPPRPQQNPPRPARVADPPAGDESDDDTDLAEVGPLGAFAIRFLPIALLAGLIFFLIVITAVAGNQGDETDDRVRSDVGALEVIDCALLTEIDGVVYPQLVGCSGRFDALVVAEVPTAEECPPDVEAVAFGSRVLCVHRVDGA